MHLIIAGLYVDFSLKQHVQNEHRRCIQTEVQVLSLTYSNLLAVLWSRTDQLTSLSLTSSLVERLLTLEVVVAVH